MDLEHLMTDRVFLVRGSGARSGPYKTALHDDKCLILDKTLDIEPGDLVVRPLPNGKEEHYTVLRADFQDDFHSIPGGFNLTLRKSQQLHAPPSSVVNNVSISNSSGIQVGNHNLQNVQVALNQLIQAIDAQDAPEQSKAEAKSRLKALLEHPLVVAVLGGISGALG